METFIAQLLNQFESGKINRRQLVRSISLAAGSLAAGESLLAEQTEGQAARTVEKTPAQKEKTAELKVAMKEAPLKAIQVSHFRYTCKDYRLARDFYQEVMGWYRFPVQTTAKDASWRFIQKE